MIDLVDAVQLDGDPGDKLAEFRRKYFDLVDDAKNLFFTSNSTTKTKESSIYWKLGRLFYNFNSKIKNEFVITNFSSALHRDFGLSSRYVNELIIFSTLFKKNEVYDSISFSVYRAFVWKKNQLEAIGLLELEKENLIKKGKHNEKILREKYKKYLNELINSKLTSRN